MKIGIYAGKIPPPVFIENLVNGLADRGNEIIVYGKPLKRDYTFKIPNVIQRKVPITRIGLMLYSIYSIFKLVFYEPRSYLSIFKMIKKSSKNWVHFFQRTCRVLPPFLDNLDILHIQWAKNLVQDSEFIEKIKCPVVLSLRGAHINYSPLADHILAEEYNKYFPMVSVFHAVSNAIAMEAEKYSADTKKITIIPPAVNEKLINNVLKTIIPSELLNIISVGRCHWKKGYTFALDAMCLLKKKGIKFHYTIIASGRDYEYILYQIHDLDLSGYVSFINGLSHEEVLENISESDLFLLSSLEEGISNAALEAMALNVPVISTDCGGMIEVIDNGINGFLVPVRDINSMANTIIKFIDLDESHKTNIILNARETIIKNHLISHQIDQFISLYDSML